MIEIKDLTLKTRQPILQDASFTFQDHNIYLLHALNGVGKTTVLRAIVNLIKPNSGQILFDQQRFNQVKQQVFYFETSDWFDKNLSGLDYLKFVQKEWHSQHSLQREIDRWQMQDYIKTAIKKYSLGMKQKLLIALYAVSEAKYLLMDEINNGLDEGSRQVLYQELAVLVNDGKLIIIASHYQDEIKDIIDNTLTIKQGKLVAG